MTTKPDQPASETPRTDVSQLRATARMLHIKGDQYTASLIDQAADTQQNLQSELAKVKAERDTAWNDALEAARQVCRDQFASWQGDKVVYSAFRVQSERLEILIGKLKRQGNET